jgi:hypothetical protein
VVIVTGSALTMVQRFDLGPQVQTSYHDLFLLGSQTAQADEQLYYDAAHARWVAAERSWDCATTNGATFGWGYLDFAISDGPDPTKGWSGYYFTYQDQVPTSVGLGNARDSFVLTTSNQRMVDNACNLEENDGNDVFSVDWASVLAGGELDVTYWSYASGADWFRNMVPALQDPATDPVAHLVSDAQRSSGPNQVVHMTVNATTGFIHSEFLTDTDVVREFLAPPAFTQSNGKSLTLRSFGATSAAWQSHRLVFATNDRCIPAGDSTERACARVVELDTTTVPATLAQDLLYGAKDLHTYAPGVALSGDGNLHLTAIRSSSTVEPAVVAARQAPGDPPNTLSASQILDQAVAPFDDRRVENTIRPGSDPLVPDSVWVNAAKEGDYELDQLTTAAGDTYQPITPIRILDTRVGTGLSGPFVTGVPRTIDVAGAVGGTIPTNAVAITGNVTVVGQNSAGYVAVGPGLGSTPATSTINVPLGDIRANNLTLPLDASGDLNAVFKGAAGTSTQLLLDVTGYFVADTTGATYEPVTSTRILDSRSNLGVTGHFVSSVPKTFQVTGTAGIPAGARAITGNLTVVGQTSRGFVALTPEPVANPATSTLNVPLGDVRANGVTTPLSATGTLSAVFKSATGTTTDIILDVTGYYLDGTSGLRFYPLNPARIMDTRSNALTQLFGPFTSSVPRTLVTGGHFGVPDDAQAVTGNLTVTGQQKAGYVAITQDPTPTPLVSTLNFPVGDNRANGATVPLNADHDLAMTYKSAIGAKTHLIFDVTGYFR